jgi:hypothetical protein
MSPTVVTQPTLIKVIITLKLFKLSEVCLDEFDIIIVNIEEM